MLRSYIKCVICLMHLFEDCFIVAKGKNFVEWMNHFKQQSIHWTVGLHFYKIRRNLREYLLASCGICSPKAKICLVIGVISERETRCTIPRFRVKHNLCVAIIRIHVERSTCNHVIRTISANALVRTEMQKITLDFQPRPNDPNKFSQKP